ncbi:MAG: hypothetical protein A2901_07215 [Elusimicrobia bacterium RIFCSPLOWO2_01_FULL_54_10]|nr:MAG: hypothetical protein A2901_07215 [Elusimicrobia bacterium RIFCSPLOWO2_01_FULL_54_10]
MTLSLLLLLFIAFIGLTLGSFANVYFYRYPENLSVTQPRSFCTHCRTPISWFDNIPVLSYLYLRGKCRFCKASISIQYPLVELVVGLLFGAAAFKLQAQPVHVLAAFLVYVCFIFLIGGIDFATFLKNERKFGVIPDHLTLPLALAGAAFSAFNPLLNFSPWAGLACGTAVGALMAAFRWMAGKILKQEALGMGDVKMMAGVAAWLGWKGALVTLMTGSVLGTLAALPFMFKGQMNRSSPVPFGPFLALGALSAFFFV